MKGYVANKGGRWYAVVYEGLDPVTGRERVAGIRPALSAPTRRSWRRGSPRSAMVGTTRLAR
jgi:hypothetical protein